MLTTYEKASQAAQLLKSLVPYQVETFVILGSGLGAFADSLEDAVSFPYSEVPHLPKSTVEGHAGKLVIGRCHGVPVSVMAGRFHYYEGYSLEDVTFPLRIAGLAGIKNLIITNAAGGLNTDFRPGDLMIIEDHINLLGSNPLRGLNDSRFGPRFPDMTEVYYRPFRELAEQEGNALGLRMWQGIYVAVPGPSYETPAEIRMLRKMGADAVGMSTVPEAIVARHMDMKVLGISCISNLAAGIKDGVLTHQEVLDIGTTISKPFIDLLRRIVTKI
ncbi:MAG: purine-nucleoside phosphorylase [Acidobacteriota bacterium]